MNHSAELAQLQASIIACRRCPRLVRWRERVAREPAPRFAEWTYWGKPVPSFGDPRARMLIVGLAPAAHGANRTGRMFTGDRSGDWLYRALHKAGFASQPASTAGGDGLRLKDCFITASARCAPPQNKVTRQELLNCRPYFDRELDLLDNVRVVLALGRVASDTVVDAFRSRGETAMTRRPAFGHGAVCALNERKTLLMSYHPSQQNTFTGKLTEKMFDAIFAQAKEIMRRKA